MDALRVEIPRPGIVIIRKALSNADQLRVIDVVERHGGLKTQEGKWNFFGIRGRTFDALTEYPAEDDTFLRGCFQRISNAAEAANAEIPITGVTHMLTWWYPTAKGMGWHKDDYDGNDGDPDAPVYSLTVGNSCYFEWRPVGDEENKEGATIESGDVIVFGGPQRMMLHQVKKVHRNTFQLKEDFDVRINITFRKLSQFTKDDDVRYQTDAYEQRMKEQYAAEK